MSYQSQENPFDPLSDNFGFETPALEDVIKRAVDDASRRLRVCLPGRIVAVRGNQLVDVQPTLMAQWRAEQKPREMPVLPNVPVSMPLGFTWNILSPLSIGDTGLLLFCDRSLDVWSASSGEQVDPGEPRNHDLADAIFIPGLVPNSQQTTDTSGDMVLRNGAAQLRLLASGQVHLSGGANELVDLAGQLASATASLVQVLQTAMTLTMLGPQPFIASTQTQLAEALAQLQTITSNLNTLKG